MNFTPKQIALFRFAESACVAEAVLLFELPGEFIVVRRFWPQAQHGWTVAVRTPLSLSLESAWWDPSSPTLSNLRLTWETVPWDDLHCNAVLFAEDPLSWQKQFVGAYMETYRCLGFTPERDAAVFRRALLLNLMAMR